MSGRRLITGSAAMVLAAGCMSAPLGLGLPERREGDKSILVTVQHGSQKRLFGIDDELAPSELSVSEGDEVNALFLTQTLAEARLAAGWSEEGSGDQQIGVLGSPHIEQARIERGSTSEWLPVDLPPPWLSTFPTLRPPAPPPPTCEYTAWYTELEPEQNHVAAMVPWDDEHVLVATGTWGTTIVARDGTQQVLSHELDFSTNAAFRDAKGRVWIGGYNGELTLIEKGGVGGAKITPILPQRPPDVPTIIHMDGGAVDGKTELIAVSFQQKLMMYLEGSAGWRVYEQPTPRPCLGDCDAQRVAWLSAGTGLLIDRGQDMVAVEHDQVRRMQVGRCAVSTMIERLEDGRIVLGCSGQDETSILELDERLQVLDRYVLALRTLVSFSAAAQRGDTVVGGQFGAWTAFRKKRECEPLSFGGNDLAFVVPVTDRLLALSEWKLGVGGALGREPPQRIWWVEWAPEP